MWIGGGRHAASSEHLDALGGAWHFIGSALVHAWAYRSHDLAQSVADTLYTPGGLLLALAVLLLGAMFHELGHAAALRSGGGQARGSGAGLYLIFPALYTDVTDAYRLGLVHRVAYDGSGDRQDFVQLRNVRANAELTDASFAWALPAGAATLQMPVSIDVSGAGNIKR